MLKKKYGNRLDWKRVVKKECAQAFVDSKKFKGYITLIHILEVTEPLTVSLNGENVCIADRGYMWLQQFPLERNYIVTTMFNPKGEIIVKRNPYLVTAIFIWPTFWTKNKSLLKRIIL
ncbi:hypothetical protein [Lysinibacillus halotolerans]|uniref:Uncharacterized protein n=1 Tax=Lysinibacillus halotolerans TaxID=1368476 RepID=A0A3M8H5E7_9BACI|nr:hypothetical protein [Lysinibacillus halotolerans]RNC97434.1 hypothetical protein EC501_15395 [Lysinibacillus halotolerans]